jgi:hypothetical protein
MKEHRTINIGVAAFVFGVIVHFAASRFIPLLNTDVARHWKLVHEYSAYVRDVETYNGGGVEKPFDLEPRLAALVAAGELEDVDLVLPLVPANRETNRFLDAIRG